MEKLTQELTTAEGFCSVMNANAAELGTDLKATMIRTEELDDGTEVQVEGMTPDAIKNLFNQQISKANSVENAVSFKTPGEPVQIYVDDTKIEPVETELIDGVVQIYNKAMDNSAVTNIKLSLVEGLREGEANVEANAIIGTLSIDGTSTSTTFSLENTGDYESFIIDGSNLKVGETPLTAKEYSITITATSGDDTESKEFNINVDAAYPEITALNVNIEEGLTAPLTVDTLVANLSTEGGTAPYTYSLKEENDYADFKVDGTTIKVATQIDSEGSKNITVVVTDKNNKTKEQSTEITIAGAGA